MDEYAPQEEERDPTPRNEEAEAALLGSLMLDNRIIDVVSRLQPEHFFWEVHGEVFAAIRKLAGEGKVANPITLRPYFENHPSLQNAGGASYLAQLTGSGATLIAATDFANQIIDLFELRTIRSLAYGAIERCENFSVDEQPRQIAADLEAAFADSLVAQPKRTTVSFAKAFQDSIQEIQDVSNGAEPAGFTIARYTDWNAIVGRMERQDFILLGARPSMGKTGVAATVAIGAAENGIGTDFLSLEMDRRKATRRMIAEVIYDIDDPLPYSDLVAGRLKRSHWSRLVNAQADLAKLPLTISDPPVMAVEDVAPHIRRRRRDLEKQGVDLQLVVLDYIGRLVARKKINGETEIASYISRTLKAAAKECDVAIVALSQLSRAVEQRESKRPMLADLRQSGSLEQDADTVVFLYREEYYLRQAQPKREQGEKYDKWLDELAACRNDMEIYSSKRREGALAKRVSKFLTEYQVVMDHHDPRVTNAPGLFDDNELAGWGPV